MEGRFSTWDAKVNYDLKLILAEGLRKGEIRINENLDETSSAELIEEIDEIGSSVEGWVVILNTDHCNSYTLGVFLKIHSSAQKNKTTAKFIVRRDSSMEHALRAARLIKLLEIDLV